MRSKRNTRVKIGGATYYLTSESPTLKEAKKWAKHEQSWGRNTVIRPVVKYQVLVDDFDLD